MEKCIRTILRVLENLDPGHYSRGQKSLVFLTMMSNLDTFVDIDQELGSSLFSNIILDDQKAAQIIESNLDDCQMQFDYLKSLFK